jgi:hypothetical protein
MSQNSAACARKHVATLFLPLRLRETSGWPDVSLNAKTNGNRWERVLGLWAGWSKTFIAVISLPLPPVLYHKTFGTGVLHLIQINHQPDATLFQFLILTFVYSLTCFGRFPAHHQELNDCSGSLWFYLRVVVIVVLCSWSGRPADRPDNEHTTTVTTIRR